MEKTELYQSRKSNIVKRWLFYLLGSMNLAFGIVLMIKAELGNTPWDVVSIGLYKQLGLTIGSWNIIVGVVIVASTALIKRSWPQLGTYFNMISIGVFIDLFLFLLTWFETPETILGRLILLFLGIIILGYGASFCIVANIGAGPRDDFMMVLTEKSGWKVQWVRGIIETIVLFCGWLLQGPIHIGTLIVWFSMGHIFSIAIPHSRRIMAVFLGGKQSEDFNQRAVRVNNHDGVSQ